jgi:hypothetical protein
VATSCSELQQDLLVESLLSSISVQSANVIDFRAFNVRFNAQGGTASISAATNVSLSAAGGVRVSDGTGAVVFNGNVGTVTIPGDVKITAATDVKFIGDTNVTSPFINLKSSVTGYVLRDVLELFYYLY